MKWGRWIAYAFAAAAAALLVVLIGGMAYVVKAKYAINDYNKQMTFAFNAAMMVNAEETFTDDARAVIAEYGGQRVVIAPENYKALQTCLQRQAAMPPFGSVQEEGALKITFCGDSVLLARPDADKDGFLVEWKTGEDRFVMQTRGGNHWERLVSLCMKGRSSVPNIIL